MLHRPKAKLAICYFILLHFGLVWGILDINLLGHCSSVESASKCGKVNHINLGSCHCPSGEQYHFAFPLNKRRHFRFCFCFWAMTTIANAPQGISIREACKARAKGKQ